MILHQRKTKATIEKQVKASIPEKVEYLFKYRSRKKFEIPREFNISTHIEAEEMLR